MREIKKLTVPGRVNKLTLTKDAATIRYSIDTSDVDRVTNFLLQVEAAMRDCQLTVRGDLAMHRESDTYYIVMSSSTKTVSQRFHEKPFDSQ